MKLATPIVFVPPLLLVTVGRSDALIAIGAAISTTLSVAKTGLGLLDFVSNLWQTFGSRTNSTQKNGLFGLGLIGNKESASSRHKAVMLQFEKISGKLDSIQSSLEGFGGVLRDIQYGLPSKMQWALKRQLVEEVMRPINMKYEQFRRYVKHMESINNQTLLNFAEKTVSQDTDSTQFLMKKLYRLVVPLTTKRRRRQGGGMQLTLTKGAFGELLATFKAAKSKKCELTQSPQQLAYSLYAMIAVAEGRGFTMLHFSWMLLQLYGKGPYKTEVKLSQQEYKKQTGEIMAAAQAAMRQLPNEYWRCDPLAHVEGETFVQLTELMQGYLENEIDMNSGQSCKKDCAAYNGDDEKSTGCYKDRFCKKQRRCKGKVQKCKFIEHDATVCLSKSSHRRYEWIEYKDGPLFGQKNSTCSETAEVDNWRYWFWRCDYCFCLCDDKARSDRSFSLRPSVSDLANNMIVTGIRLVKLHGIIHLQIEQGRAEPSGQVNHTGIAWKHIHQFTTEDAKEGTDFMTLDSEERSIDLDDQNAPDDHVVTGVCFHSWGRHVNLKVQTTAIDFHTGQLKTETSKWIFNNKRVSIDGEKEQGRKEIVLEDPDIQTRNKNPSWPDSTPTSYIKFRESSMKKDASQSTVPFLDIQPVNPKPPTWLTGVGIYHKGKSGYGGFVGLRVTTLDSSKRIGLTDEKLTHHPGNNLHNVPPASNSEAANVASAVEPRNPMSTNV